MWYMNEERELLQKAFREYAQKRVRPYVDKMEREEVGCKDLIKEMAGLGFLGFNITEENGGNGIDYISYGLLLEELAKEGYTVAFSMMIAYLFDRAIELGAKEGIIDKYLRPALKGEHVLGLAGNEPTGGNWHNGYQTVAKREGDNWVINGTKVLISQADVADYFMVMARSKETVDPFTSEGMECFMVDAKAKGVVVGHIENKVGLNGSRTGTVYFNDVVVSEADRLTTSNIFTVEEFCGGYGVMELGAAEAALEKTIAYLKQREQFGASIWDAHESARADVAKLYGKISNFRNALYGHFANLTNGLRDPKEAISLKLEGAKLLEEVARECIILFGGAGVIYETGIERSYRDAVISSVACASDKSLETVLSMFL